MRLTAACFIALVVSASPALGVGDQGPDMLGWYFDPDAVYWAAQVTPGYPSEAYLILTNPTVDEILGWEASFAIFGTAILIDSTVYHDGQNSLEGQAFAVTYDTPLPCVGPTILASIRILPYVISDNCLTLYSVEYPSVPGELPVLYLGNDQYMQAETCVFEDSNSSAWLGDLFGWSGPGDYPYPCAGVTLCANIDETPAPW